MKRIDNTRFLYHWVKSEPYHRDSNLDFEQAYGVFLDILGSRKIKSGERNKTGGVSCICFTESPEYFMHTDRSKYQSFGFKFEKRYIFELGGRTVIYSPNYEREFLSEDIQWRYMRHDPFATSIKTPYGVDFTWEREWRLPHDFIFVEDVHSIIVPNEKFKERLYYEFKKWVQEAEGQNDGSYDFLSSLEDWELYLDEIYKKVITPEQL